MTGSPISDMNPVLMAAGVTLEVQSKGWSWASIENFRFHSVRDSNFESTLGVPFVFPAVMISHNCYLSFFFIN